MLALPQFAKVLSHSGGYYSGQSQQGHQIRQSHQAIKNISDRPHDFQLQSGANRQENQKNPFIGKSRSPPKNIFDSFLAVI